VSAAAIFDAAVITALLVALSGVTPAPVVMIGDFDAFV
jgi:hypothetical protein